MLTVFVCVFAAVFSLYDLPVEAVGYSAALCVFSGCIFMAAGYARFYKRHRALSEMLRNVDISLAGLPEPRGAVEEDYQGLLRGLSASLGRERAMARAERVEAEDYYTLWAHQIKTPISAMRLLLQQEDSRRNEELKCELFRIEQYAEMALSYLRLDSDSSDLVLKEYDLDAIVRGCARKYAGVFILRRLSLDFAGTGLRVVTDEKWLAFVIEQLLSNALKYTRSGGIRIFANGLTLCIEDTGIGISAEDLPRVFEKGFTGYNGREDRKSTGLGLYLCRRVCDRLGHRLVISSEPGKGTRVGVVFPETQYKME